MALLLAVYIIGNIGWTEGLIILLVILILFGGKKIPQLAKDLGSGIREFRRSISGAPDQMEQAPEREAIPPQTAARPPRKAAKKKAAGA